VLNDVPVPNELPPLDAAYQLIVPDDAVAPNDTVPVPQRAADVVPDIVGIGFTVTVHVPVDTVGVVLHVLSLA
jgi:hypothetical protein